MDFGTLLHVAKKNNENVKSSESKYYSTKFSAPKKESKEKTLSDNIKKFLAKKEQEEREKARIEKEKRDRLLAMRDEKSKNKIKKMLKVIKSANKSVLEDAVDTENTAVTLHGPDQPDEDDYGYVSQEAAALYKKYMDKVKSLPEENKFTASRPISKSDLSGTKDRVRAAIQREQEEKNSQTRSKSSKQSQSNVPTTSAISSTATSVPVTSNRKKDLYDPDAERELEEKKRKEEEQKKSKPKKLAPPPLDFQELLKLAAKKQHEPVEVVVEVKKEPERLLTKKEKKELEERQKYLEAKERRRKEAQMNPNKSQVNVKIPKNDSKEPTVAPKKISSDKTVPSVPAAQKTSSNGMPATSSKDVFKKPLSADNQSSHKFSSTSKGKINTDQRNNNLPVNGVKPKPQELGKNVTSASSKPSVISDVNNLKSSSKSSITKPSPSVNKYNGALPPSKPTQSTSMRQNPPKNVQTNRKPIQSDRDIKPRQFPPADIQRSRQFPPLDVRSSKPIKKAPKRRIIDDDEDEYDSELDDFIDDGPEEDQSYSNYIKEIFGYDRARYRNIDEEDDDAAMESSFAQQMKEEYVSKKIGLMEDLEDMRLEAEEKKKKALMKKRKLK